MIYLITAPSGAGKTKLVKRLGIPEVITFTTRPPRAGEVDMVDYFFVDEETFDALECTGLFAETNFFNGYRYATPKAGLRAHHDSALIVDPNGSQNLGEYMDAEGIEYRRVWIDTPLCLRHLFLSQDKSRPPDELAQRVNDGIKEQWETLGLKADIVLPMADHPLPTSVA